MTKFLSILILFVMLSGQAVWPDTFRLKNGEVVEGHIESQNDQFIQLATPSGKMTLLKAFVVESTASSQPAVIKKSTHPYPSESSAPKHSPQSSGWLEGSSGYKTALSQKSPFLLYVYTDWCGYCTRFSQNVLSTSEFEQNFRSVPKVKINGDSFPDLIGELGVKGFPSVFIVRSETERSKIKASKNAAEFIAQCQTKGLL